MAGYASRVTPSLHSSSSSLPHRGHGAASPALSGAGAASRSLLNVAHPLKAAKGGRDRLTVAPSNPANPTQRGDSARANRIPWESADTVTIEQQETMSDTGSTKSSPRKLRHRPLLSPKTHSDETPTRRTLRAPRSPTISLDETSADYADDEQGKTGGSVLHRGRRGSATAASEDAITSPSRKQRLKQLIHKSSKISLRGLTGRDELSPSASQELFAPPTLLTTPPRDISSPSSSSPSRFAISTRTSPRTPSPSPFFELSPRQLPRSVSYGDDASLASNTSRDKAARLLGEEIVPSGKAALVLGLEEKPTLMKRPSNASLLSPDSPTSRADSFPNTSSAVPPKLELLDLPAPMLLVPGGHQRQRSLSGPSVFASLDIPLTTPETSASSEKKFSFDLSVKGTESTPSKSAGPAVPSGLVTPPPSPPVPLKPANRTPSLADLLDRTSNRSPEKIVSVASSTYEPSIFEGDELRRPSHGRRLTLDSVCFSSIVERASTPSSSSHRSSQNHSNFTRRESDGTSSSQRSSVVVRARPPLGGRSFSASVLQRSKMELPPLPNGTTGSQPASLLNSLPIGMRIRGFDALQEPMSEPELPSISEYGSVSSRARPKRTNTIASVASARTRTLERSDALAALEGSATDDGLRTSRPLSCAQPCPPPTFALPPIPSGLPAFPSPPTSSLPLTPPQPGGLFLPRSESFLDFDLSSEDENDRNGAFEFRRQANRCFDSALVAREDVEPPGILLDGQLSARLSSLPFRSDTDEPSWITRQSRDFPQEPQLSRSYSSPLLKSASQFEACSDVAAARINEHGRKNSTASKTAESMLSLSSDEEDPDGADWTSAFPQPPRT